MSAETDGQSCECKRRGGNVGEVCNLARYDRAQVAGWRALDARLRTPSTPVSLRSPARGCKPRLLYRVENSYTVVELKISPGRRTVVGKAG